MTQVRCSVDTCQYWGEGQVCRADSIWVRDNAMHGAGATATRGAAGSARMEIADEPGTVIRPGQTTTTRPGSSASTSNETCCGTMKPRGGRSGVHAGKHGSRKGT